MDYAKAFDTVPHETLLAQLATLGIRGSTQPHLEYASVNWNPALKRDKDTLEQVQRRATRLAQGLSHLSYSDRLASLRFYNFADYE
ncbi:hypothetical protein Pcinc_035014 [Petrolisthes cinctipes]|uniref:Uncharacterized protein n=1 Tax=Petrolisthes cinctipes TaxID=88211 RepID=A0AAE1C0M1_PETCI|nr:hypothetical protein Pcinc_035014 [Petrolisthes cinctipes]